MDDNSKYKEIGFMCGLEIHQRLATTHKLFCACPTTAIEEDKMDMKISRYQRAVAGELGNIDRSAEFEELRNRKFTYMIHEKTTCLVEIDEEPPHQMNHEALEIALSLASTMGMAIIDELQPMRKEVVDGSDPSAFQRTTLIGVDGKIKVEGYEINMPSLFLEEESSGVATTTEDSVLYDTNRLGIPLVEIDTDPYIPNPKAAKAIALYIGTLLRISGKVQRGIGSIRQDVNVSIKGGNRVEIKGLQELDKIDRFIENEVARQQKLLEIRDILVKSAKARVDENTINLTELLNHSKVRIVTNQIEKGGIALGFKLEGFKGILGKEINPDRRLGSEISDYAKMAKVNGIIHSDENLDSYGFTASEVEEIRKKLKLGEWDAFIIIAGSKSAAIKAVNLAIERAKYALVGVPLETRAAANIETCTTKFMRPLPGGSRMYPETDARPILITKEHLKNANKNAPNIEKEKKEILSMLDNKEIADHLLTSQKLQLFKRITSSTKADPNFVANILIQKFTELRRNGFNVDSLDEERLAEIFVAYEKGQITKNAVEELLKEASLKKAPIDELIKTLKLGRIKGAELEKLVENVSKDSKDNDANALRGKLMAQYRLNVDGGELNELLSKQRPKKVK